MDKWIDDYIKIRGTLDKKNDFTLEKMKVAEDEVGVLRGYKIKEADFKLKNDSSVWTDQILEKLYEEYDWIDPENYYIKWRNEFEEGNALGVIVLEKNGKGASIPLIVDNYKLAPLDLVYDVENEKISPLTPFTLEKIFFDSEIVKDVSDGPKGGKKIMKSVFAPGGGRGGRHVYASVLDEISFLEEDVADFHASIKNDDVLFNTNRNETFKKVAHKIINNPKLVKEEEIEKISSAIIEPNENKGYKTLYKTEEGIKTKIASYYETYEFFRDKFNMTKEALDKKISFVDQDKIVIISKEKTSSIVEEPDIKPINESGCVEVQNADGPTMVYVVPKVLRIEDGQLLHDGAIVLNDDREMVNFVSQVVGKSLESQKSLMDLIRIRQTKKPIRNELISFVWYDPRLGDYTGLQPSKLLQYQEIAGLGTMFSVMSAFGKRYNVIIAKHIVKSDFSKDNKHEAILLPEETIWINQGNEQKFSDNPAHIKESMLKNYTKFRGKYFRSTDSFDFMDKKASSEEVILKLASMGVSSNNIKQFIKEAANKKEADIFIQIKKEKKAEDLTPIIKTLKQNTVKLASQIKDEETVDSVLSLNFINDKNLEFFFKKLPEFKSVIDGLAALLLASRLGNTGVDPSIIKEAVISLQELIEKMEGYKFG